MNYQAVDTHRSVFSTRNCLFLDLVIHSFMLLSYLGDMNTRPFCIVDKGKLFVNLGKQGYCIQFVCLCVCVCVCVCVSVCPRSSNTWYFMIS